MAKKALFIGSTGQHVGKTTTSLGLTSGMHQYFDSVSFMKPVGQEHVAVEGGVSVDKDVLLFKEYFNLDTPVDAMSPVLFPRGFTRQFLDGKVDRSKLVTRVQSSFHDIQEANDFVVVEGTGHVGVGSIIDLNNAQVAKLLNLNVVLIVSGGLGSAIDALAINLAMCQQYGVNVIGVIVNRVLEDKREMVTDYISKALTRWDLPLLGCIPFDAFLSNPTCQDFELLFGTTLLSGEEFHMRHFRHIRLVATSLKTYRGLIADSQLIITPAIREDIILATLTKCWDVKIDNPDHDLKAGMILTGDEPPRQSIIEALKKANVPMLYVPLSSYNVMKMITSYTVKIRKEDTAKIKEAIDLVKGHVDFDKMLDRLA